MELYLYLNKNVTEISELQQFFGVDIGMAIINILSERIIVNSS